MIKEETDTLTSQVLILEKIDQKKEMGIDISQAETEPPVLAKPRGRRTWRSVGLAVTATRRLSLTIENSRRRNSYINPLTGGKIEWVERSMDEKVFL